MRIKCWGSRGSVAVSGKNYLKYGGDTTCFEVQADSGETVIIDAGTGIRRLGKALVQRQVESCHLLFTHAHWDHIIGLPFFHPMLSDKTCVHIQDRFFGGLSSQQVIHRIMTMPFFPVNIDDYKADIRFDASLNDQFRIGSLQISTITTSHSQDSVGYRFEENGHSFVFLTDNELGFAHPQSRSFQDYVDFSKNADILFHDTEYTDDEYTHKKGWGHSRISDVLNLATNAIVGQLGLIHHNQDREDAAVDQMVDVCRRFFQKKKLSTTCYAVPADFEINL